MPAYFGTWQVVAAEPVPPELLGLARKLVGGMLEVGVPKREWKLADGSVIHALIVNGIPKVTITQATGAAVEETPFSDMWVPRGFVVYPAFNSAKLGYGLPIVADPDAGPYAPSNLAPGLDVARWTAGGPCGEVLVSQDTEAGYPTSTQAIPVPLLYHPTLGPTFHWNGEGFYDQREAEGAWQSYRMELAAPVANYSDEDVAASLALFEAINTYRTDNGQQALNLLPRGYYRPAKVMASIMLINGSTDATSAGYPATYQTEDERLTKDGFSAEVIGVTFDAFNRGDHPTAFELRHLGGGEADALAAWQAVPADDAVLLKDVGPAAFADIGYRGGYWCADVIERTRWIDAGNMSWQSPDESLPPISWHGFASINLAWETYPATYDATNYATAPLVPLRSFTDGQGDCWLRYPRSTDPTAADMEPAMGRHIYCRGRAIALAPRGGLVWAAGVVAMDGKDRLIALIHHPDETPTDYTHEGFTRYLRVWWCDVPKRAGLRLDPPTTICGIASGDDYAWQGGEQIDLGTMPDPSAGFVAAAGVNSLKYASQWRFSPDGKHAACLRDYGAFAEYGVVGATPGYQWNAGMNPRTVVLDFAATEDAVATTVTFHDYTAGLLADDRAIATAMPPDTDDAFDIAMVEKGAIPLAVDYDGQGGLVYAYTAAVSSTSMVTYTPVDAGRSFSSFCFYGYVGVGDSGVRYATDMLARVLHGARFKTASVDTYHELPVVLDVLTATMALKCSQHRFAVTPTDTASGAVLVEDVPCQHFTSGLVDGVRLCRGGAVARTDWYPCPDGAVFTTNDECFTGSDPVGATQVYLPLAVSGNVQGHYAERAEHVVFGYQCAPTPLATPVLDAEPSDDDCGCWMTAADVGAAHWMTDDELAPRGGAAGATVPLPANNWLIYSKVV